MPRNGNNNEQVINNEENQNVNENANVNENVNVNENPQIIEQQPPQGGENPPQDDFWEQFNRAGEQARQRANERDHLHDALNRRDRNDDEDIIDEQPNEANNDNNNDQNNDQNEQNVDAPNNQNPQRELTAEEMQRRAQQDEHMAQIMENFRRDMAAIDAEEEEARRARRQGRQEGARNNEPEQVARRPVKDLFGNDDDDDDNAEFDPFAPHQRPVAFQAPAINAVPQPNPQIEEENNAHIDPNDGEAQQNNPPRELTEEERQRRAQDDARMEQAMQNFRQSMADIDAEEEEERRARRQARAQNNEPEQVARRPINDLFGNDDDDDDNAEFDPFAPQQGPVAFQVPAINAVPQPNPQIEEENNAQVEPNEGENNAQGEPNEGEVQQNNPPRELTEEERQRRAQDDARMEQAMQNFRQDMADIDAEEEAEKQARRAERAEAKRLRQEELKRVEQERLARAKVEQDFFTNLDNEGDLFAESQESIDKKAQRTERKEKMEAGAANESVFQNTLQAYNTMYKTNVNADDFASRVSDAVTMMKKTDPAEAEKGKKMLGDLFKETLKKTYELEKEACYNEHRIPDFPDIVKSTNGLMRSAMYAFTDMYHDKNNIPLFDQTAYAGLSAEELAEVAKTAEGDGLWGMDQKSDEAWEKQSKAAKDIAKQWLEEDRPYEKMIQELNDLAEQARTNASVGRIDRMNKLMAAEWMLTNNPKMMIEDPEDPYNTIPNWGNKYWKTLSAARDALGISKHTSMRDLVQADYAEAARAINSTAYNQRQVEDYALDENVRQVYDNRTVQMNQFATQAAAAILTEQQSKQKADEIIMTDDKRVQISVRECDEKVIWKSQPKENNFVVEKAAELDEPSVQQAK